nr:MAG TPA: hypothetical protein [Caudoviricetes sp.]
MNNAPLFVKLIQIEGFIVFNRNKVLYLHKI